MLYEFRSMEVINEKQYNADAEGNDVLDYIETFLPGGVCDYGARFSDLLPDGYVLTSHYYEEPLVTRGSFMFCFFISNYSTTDDDIFVVITDEFDSLAEQCGVVWLPETPYCVWDPVNEHVYLVIDYPPQTIREAVELLYRFRNRIRDCAYTTDSGLPLVLR